jgi:hypothetical protein
MNQRIQELAEQCVSWSDGSTWTSRKEFNQEKFAGLMIEQFLEIAHNNLHPQAYAQVLTAVQQRFEITQ